jgi:hypothetical protein
MDRIKRALRAGSAGNEQLTSMVAAVLLLLLSIELATLLQLEALLTVHAFVGMLLIPIVGLKLASSGWRMLRYYLKGEEYVRRGPPHVFLRVLVAPVLMLSTIVLFASGVALLVAGRVEGTLLGLHQASFVVWAGAAAVHVLAHASQLPGVLRARLHGLGLRLALVTGALLGGALLAVTTLPAVDRLQDSAATHVGFEER